MKNILIYLTICIGMILMSCEEEEQSGQFAIDNVAPGMITDLKIKNQPGESWLTYTVPNDNDLLYVEAEYVDALGKTAVRRASAFLGALVVDGFLKSEKVAVKIVCVDKSKNRSQPLMIEIEPLDNVIFNILSSLKYQAAFGGVRLDWLNELEKEIVVEVLVQNMDTEQYETFQNIYTQGEEGVSTVRGLDAVETNFGVVVRDHVGLRTDTVKFSLVPYFEEELDYEKFRLLPHNPDFVTAAYSTGFASLFNNINATESFNIMGAGIGVTYFSMDLGEKYKLSRFTMFSRHDFIYGHSQPKHFMLLGTNDVNVANNPYSEEGWTIIGDFNDEKPSGNPSTVAPTSEDREAFYGGMEFEVDLGADYYQYVRWITLETWGSTDRMWLSELDMFGQKKVTDED